MLTTSWNEVDHDNAVMQLHPADGNQLGRLKNNEIPWDRSRIYYVVENGRRYRALYVDVARKKIGSRGGLHVGFDQSEAEDVLARIAAAEEGRSRPLTVNHRQSKCTVEEDRRRAK